MAQAYNQENDDSDKDEDAKEICDGLRYESAADHHELMDEWAKKQGVM